LEHAITSCWVLATASAGFLFLRRVQALYPSNRIVSYFFISLYITNVGVSIVTPIGSRAGPLADTGYCINGGVAHYVSATVFMTLAYDTMVFLAISYKVATEHGKPGRPVNLKSLITGEAFPRLSRAILQGGQQYYLITVCLNILISVLIVAPSVPPIYEATFTIPDIAVTSSMACRVYRNLRLVGRHSPGAETYSSMKFGTVPKSTRLENPTPGGTQVTGSTLEADLWGKKTTQLEDIEMSRGANGGSSAEEIAFHEPRSIASKQKSSSTLKENISQV